MAQTGRSILMFLRVILGIALVLILGMGAFLFSARLSDGPRGLIAGGPFTSGEIQEPGGESDLSFVRNVQEVEFQLVDPPRSRTTWIVEHAGKAYIPSGYMTSWWGKLWKQWPIEIERDPRILLRVEGKIYERKLIRIEDGPAVAPVVAELSRKYAGDAAIPIDAVTSGSLWLFEVAPRD